MNKKNLSVVMAGAMLATSVAPVLAATESSVSIDNKLLLASNIETKMKSKEISSNADIKNVSNGYVSKEVSNLMAAGKSAYGVKVIGNDGKVKKINNFETSYDIAQVKTFLTGGNLAAGDKIEVYEKATTNFYGEVIPGTEIKQKEEVKITNFDAYLSEIKAKTNFVESVTKNKDGVTAEVKLKSLTDIKDTNSNVKLTVTAGGTMLDLNLPLDAEGNVTTDPMECVNFANKYTYTPSQKVTEEPTLVETINVTAEASNVEKYNVSDLYDGFAFTSKGTELMDMINNEKYVAKYNVTNNKDYTTSKSSFEGYDTAKSNVSSIPATNGVYTLGIAIEDTKGRLVKELSVVSTKKDNITGFFKLLGGEYKVGVVAGDNRYETAVNVDKAIGRSNLYSGLQKGNGHIVLVNGTSLVDGLAAAPLAASLKWNDTNKKPAPVLLSETDKLPTATKEYINELTSEIAPKNRANVTINLVGGESVLSESLEKELKDMGFSVVRYGGDNREETSLEVAEAIGTNNFNNAFVVGGNGEADAMSIAAVASNKQITETGTKVSPIIVSSVNGLSKDAVRFIDRNLENKDVTIVGGESVVSKAEEAKIDEVITKPVTRVSGANRFETNAKIVEKYYKDENSIVAVKDGISNPSELVDALSAANYAATMNAPVILASETVKDTQKNALLKTVGSTKVEKVVQVGNGAERSVLVTLADMFGVKNN